MVSELAFSCLTSNDPLVHLSSSATQRCMVFVSLPLSCIPQLSNERVGTVEQCPPCLHGLLASSQSSPGGLQTVKVDYNNDWRNFVISYSPSSHQPGSGRCRTVWLYRFDQLQHCNEPQLVYLGFSSLSAFGYTKRGTGCTSELRDPAILYSEDVWSGKMTKCR